MGERVAQMRENKTRKTDATPPFGPSGDFWGGVKRPP